MKLPEDEFWQLTMRELDALVSRYRQAEIRADLRAGTVAALIANVNRDPKRRPQPYTPADFFGTLKREKSTEEMLAVAEALTTAFGGTDTRKGALE